MLYRDELIRLAVDNYFIGCNEHGHEKIMSTMSEDCLMRFPAASFRYDGAEPLAIHFTDFLGNFPSINFHDFVNIVDVESQSIVTYFKVFLTDHEGAEIRMQNCNIFHCNDVGLFNEIIIYNTKTLDKGFHEGSD